MVQNVRPILDGYRDLALEDAEAINCLLAKARSEPTLENCRRLKWKMELAAQSMQRYIQKELAFQRLEPGYTPEPMKPQLGCSS